jgi:uncharacterized protein
MLYPGDKFRMADELLEEYVKQLVGSHRTPDVTVAWQGGEPTMMGLDFFRRSVELFDIHRKQWQRMNYTIQTNGVLIDERWANARRLPSGHSRRGFVRSGDERV